MDEQKEKKQLAPEEQIAKYRKQFVQSTVFVVVTLMVLILFCFAWFVNNSSVSADGIQVTTQDSRFEIATSGTKRGIYDPDNLETGDEKVLSGSTEKYYITSGAKSSISWMVGEENNLNNTSAGATLGPQSSGSLSFSIFPLSADVKPESLNFTLEIIPYKLGTENQAAQDGAVTIDGQYYVPLDKETDSEAYNLLKGHLLFFSSYDISKRYSGIIETGEAFQASTLTQNDTSNEEHWDYTLHWIWPGWFRQFVDKNEKDSLFSTGNENGDYNKMIKKINAKKDFFFKKNSADENIGDVSENMSTTELDIFSSYYNNGDEAIGNTVRFVQLKLTAFE
jgi:hypothetical protein